MSGNYEVTNLDDVKLQSYFLSLDYKFNHTLNPYIGLSLGTVDLTWKMDPLNTSKNRDFKSSSFLYGVQAGLIYPIVVHWSLYTQVAYQKFDIDTKLTATNTSNVTTKSTISHEDKKSLGIGLRYSF